MSFSYCFCPSYCGCPKGLWSIIIVTNFVWLEKRIKMNKMKMLGECGSISLSIGGWSVFIMCCRQISLIHNGLTYIFCIPKWYGYMEWLKKTFDLRLYFGLGWFSYPLWYNNGLNQRFWGLNEVLGVNIELWHIVFKFFGCW